VRLVLDSKARLSPESRLAASARSVPVWLLCTAGAQTGALAARGVEIVEVAADAQGRVDITAAAQELGRRGLTRVLVEGGGEVAAALLAGNLVDRLTVYRSGLVLGGDSRSAIGHLGLEKVGSAPRFSLVSTRRVGADAVESWRRGA
jgi:diaminohydroxyphosphoribosylaminopyrimidine deaminase/5-amino-6-(5-phosphoribosylamino)uracil reductase